MFKQVIHLSGILLYWSDCTISILTIAAQPRNGSVKLGHEIIFKYQTVLDYFQILLHCLLLLKKFYSKILKQRMPTCL